MLAQPSHDLRFPLVDVTPLCQIRYHSFNPKFENAYKLEKGPMTWETHAMSPLLNIFLIFHFFKHLTLVPKWCNLALKCSFDAFLAE